MPDNRKIKSSVRHGGETYGPGREDELAEILDKDKIDRLVAAGSIEGDWSPGAKKAAAEDAKAAAADEKVIEKGIKDATNAPGDQPPVPTADLGNVDNMNRDQLEAYAKAKNIKVTKSMTNDEIKAAIAEKASIPTETSDVK